MAKSKREKLEDAREWKRNNAERHAELNQAYRARNPQKIIAQNRLGYAIRSGVLKRMPCEGCGTNQRVHAHHHDYSKPLEVHWLCYLCHKAAHPVRDEDKQIKFADAQRARLPGELNPNAALTNKQVAEIRSMLEHKVSQQRIADAFGVHQGTISRIKLGKAYR